jgi:nitrilase
VAPTAGDSGGWQATARHISVESGTFVVTVRQYLPRSAFPGDFPALIPRGVECLRRGGAVIIDPMGSVIARPLYDAEGLVVADLRVGLRAKRWFDAVGHYSRPDLVARTPAPETGCCFVGAARSAWLPPTTGQPQWRS